MREQTLMRALRRLVKLGAGVLVGLLMNTQGAWGAACTSVATGNWSAQTTWGAAGTGCAGATGGIPGAADTVTIGATHTVTLIASAAASSVTIAAATAANGIVLGGNTLAIGGNVIMTAVSTTAITSTFNVGTGTLTAASITINGSGTANRIALMTVSGGTITTTGSITFAGTAAQAKFTSTGASTVNVAGNFGSGGTLTTTNTGTINFNGAGGQTIGAYTTYNNVTIANTAGGVSLLGTTTVGGALSVNSGTLTVGAFAFTVTGATTVNSTLSITSTTGAKAFTGNVIINNGGTLSETVAAAMAYGGDVTINTGGTLTEFGAATMSCAGSFQKDGSYTASTGVHTFSGTNKTFGGASPIVIPSVTVNGTYQNNGTLTIATALAGTGTLTNGANSTLNLNFTGTVGISALRADAVGNTVNYGFAGAQTVKLPVSVPPATYYHLTLSGSGTKTMPATAMTILGNFTMSGTAATSATAAQALTVGGNVTIGVNSTFTSGTFIHSVAGNWSNNGTFTAGAGTVRMNGAVAQTIGGSSATTFNNLIIINTTTGGGVTMGLNSTLSGTLTLTTGTFAVGANTLTLNGPAIAGTLANLTTTASSSLSFGGTAASVTVPSSVAALNNLTINNTSGVTLGGSPTLSGTLTLSAGALAVGANTLTLNGPAIAVTAGTLTTTASSSLSFGGTAASVTVPASVALLNNLTINNSSGVTLGGSSTLSGVLALTSGALTTGANTLTLSASCPGSYSRSSGYVIGNLLLAFPAGTSTCIYHVGDSIGYAPITVAMVGATAGTLTGRSDAGDHPDTGLSFSGVDGTKSANHYWTLTAGTLATYTSYSATFQFCANTGSCVTPTELDTGANTGNFIVVRKISSAWSTPTLGTKTSYSTQATGITSANGFGEFAVGELDLSTLTLHHIKIEHGGVACTATPASITVKACADAACTALYPGSVTVDLTPNTGGSLTWAPTEPVTFSGGFVDMTLANTTANTQTLGGTATAPTASNATQCFNGATQTCALVYSVCTVDAVESSATSVKGTPIYTKLAGTAFILDVVRVAGGTQAVTAVQLVDASSGTCSTYPALANTVIAPTVFTLNGGTPRQVVTFTSNNAAPNVRVRMTVGSVSCSSDNFAVRPTGLTVTSTANADATGSSTSATPVVKAGTNFTLSAASGRVGYNTTPKLDLTKVAAHTGAVQIGTLAGSFGSANPATGTATGAAFTYNEVGYFNLAVNGVYDDTFTAVDSVGATPDCTNDFSNSAVGGKYGCKFGNTATTGYFGRFIPDHFTISGSSLTAACTAATSFSYFGQDGFTTAFTLTAQNNDAPTNGTTQNYTGGFARLGLTTYANYHFSAATLPTGSVLASSATAPSGTWLNGVANNVSATHQISRPTALTGESSITVSAAPIDSDGVAGATTAMGSATRLRYGRLHLLNAYGSELLALPVSLTAQYWNGTSFIQNADDSCTAIVAPSSGAGLTFYPEVLPNVLGNHLSAAETTATVSATGKLAAGDAGLKFAKPGAGNGGYVDIAIPLASQPWLKYNWKGAGDADPTSRATFGIFKSPLIYRRENY